MRRTKAYISVVFLIIVSFLLCGKVLAEFDSNLSTNSEPFLGCGQPDPNNNNTVYNGCISIVGYYYTIIKEGRFEWASSNIGNQSISYKNFKYEKVDRTKEYYEASTKSPSKINDDIKSGGSFFKKILRETDYSSSSDFFNSNYSILIEPEFKIIYDTEHTSYVGGNESWRSWKGNETGKAKIIAEKILRINKGFPPGSGYSNFNGFWSVNKNIPCTAYIAESSDNYDSYCKNPADKGSRVTYLQMAKNINRYGKWIISASDITQSYSLTIHKEAEGSPKSNVLFYIKKGESYISQGYTNSYGNYTSHNLSAGEYTIIETVPRLYSPSKSSCSGCESGPSVDDNLVSFTVKIDRNKTVTITNEKTCESEFNASKSKGIVSMPKRIELYNKYRSRNLLNLSKTEASDACDNTTDCTKSLTLGCLNGFIGNTGFGANNLSCYETTVDFGGKTGYCATNFILGNNLKNNADISNVKINPTINLLNYEFEGKGLDVSGPISFGTFKSGQMFLKRIGTPAVALGEVTKICYFYSKDDIVPTSSALENYSTYIGDLKLNGKVLHFDEVEADDKDYYTEKKDSYTQYIKTYMVKYYLPRVNFSSISGRITYDFEDKNCRDCMYGFASKLTDKGEYINGEHVDKEYIMPFELEVKESLYSLGINTNNVVENACKYNIKNEITDDRGKLNLEFRIIDTNNPFPGKSGNGRNVGENWCALSFDVNNDGKINGVDSNIVSSAVTEMNLAGNNLSLDNDGYDYNKDGKKNIVDMNLIKRAIKSNLYVREYDLYRDGTIDKNDEELFAKKITNNTDDDFKKNCSSTNAFIKAVMNNTNNSYNKNKIEPMYIIELNPSKIKKIREYNKEHSYDDYGSFLKNYLGLDISNPNSNKEV